jgi:hypothetical protein
MDNNNENAVDSAIIQFLNRHPKSDVLSIWNFLKAQMFPNIEKKDVNRALYKMKESGQIVMKRDNSTRPLWSRPSERTSYDELHDLVQKYYTKLTELKYDTLFNGRGRYNSTCSLKFEGNTILFTGKAEIVAERAMVRAAHGMLGKLALLQSEPFSKEASRLFSIALHRGSEFLFGAIYKPEGRTIEYKGGPNENEPWTQFSFQNCFKKQAGKIMCGFINRNVLNDHPRSCEILFGVHSTGKIQGIRKEAQQFDMLEIAWNSITDDILRLVDVISKKLQPSPTIYGFETEVAPVDSNQEGILYIVIVHLPMGAPLKSCTYKNKYYVRKEASTVFATPDEVAILKQKQL